jgi:hypothetical protein
VIDGKQGSYNGAVLLRDWVIRLNLPENSKPANIMINGKKVKLNSADAAAYITQSEIQGETMPFNGAGSKPRPMAGPILEMTVHQRDVLKPIRISCKVQEHGKE